MKSFLFFSLRLSVSAAIMFSIAISQPKREFRGAWVATVANLDWPTLPGDSPGAQRTQLATIFDQLKAAGINAIIFQVRPECDALYKSSIEPWSYYLTGQQGRAPSDPDFDPLQFAVDEAHKRGMELHAWFNPYRAVRSIGAFTIDTTHVSVRHPDWILTFPSTKLKILDPGLPQVRDYVSHVVADIVRRYDVDGVHADDYFYPYDPIISNEDDATFANYSRGFTNRGDWRRDNVNLLMKQLSDSIKAIKPFVKFGMSPFGIWKNGVPPGITGLDAYSEIYGDAIAWLHQQTIDYLAPQLYWKIGGPQDYSKLMPWWADSTNAYGRHLYTGHIYGSYTTSELPNQVRLNRANAKVQGSIFFRAANVQVNTLNFTDSMKTNLYYYPSLLPVMSWKDVVPPYPPRAIRYAPLASTGRPAIQWDLPLTAPDGDSASRYAVYRFDHNPVLASELNDARNLIAVEGQRISMPANQSSSAGPYYYIVTALDRNYNESDTSNVLKISAPPVPVLASPVSGTSSVPESVTVVWRASALAYSYVLQVSTDPLFISNILVNDSTLADTFKVVHGLVGQAGHYWRVKAVNAGGASAFSASNSFITGFPLVTTPLSPANIQSDVVTNPTFLWLRSAAATSYRFQLAKSADFSAPVIDTTGLQDTTVSVSQLQYYTIYFWRVKATNAVGTSDWSIVFRFRTSQSTSTGRAEDLPTEYSLSQNYPNPFNPVTTIQFALPVSGHVVIKIYDMLGREVATLIDEDMPAGRHTVPWDASNDASGVYFAHMLSGPFEQTRRMILIK